MQASPLPECEEREHRAWQHECRRCRDTQKLSEREKFYIASHYESFVTGNLEAARKTYELWAQTYPRDNIPPGMLGIVYGSLGDYDKALAEAQEAMKLDPGSGIGYNGLVLLLRARQSPGRSQSHGPGSASP